MAGGLDNCTPASVTTLDPDDMFLQAENRARKDAELGFGGPGIAEPQFGVLMLKATYEE
jgi:hypothetical protein